MRPLTDNMPKPLLKVGDKPLIQWHIERLAAGGFRQIVINHAYRGQMIEDYLGDGSRYGVHIDYSPEAEALETAGGIANALTLLDEVFLVVNGDVYCDFDFGRMPPTLNQMKTDAALMAHLVMVDNPSQHPSGDFALECGKLKIDGERLTFSGIALYRRELFQSVIPGSKARLAPLLKEWMAKDSVGGEHYAGRWVDVGTPERLADLDAELNRSC